MKNEPLLHEILWILSCTIFTIIVGFVLFGKTIFSTSIDLNLHDTYFVIRSQHFLISFFIIISFFVYFFKELKYSFCRKIQRSFIFFLGFILILLASLAVQLLPFFNPYHNINGWTIYPPLSMQPEINQHEQNFIILTIVSKAVLILQIIVVSMMLSVTYKWGRSKNNQLGSTSKI
jgi:heme/copper-type cytochrome/quinol oxidase subunit 1